MNVVHLSKTACNTENYQLKAQVIMFHIINSEGFPVTPLLYDREPQIP